MIAGQPTMPLVNDMNLNRPRKTRHSARGFSFIEVLGTVGILATISAIGVTNYHRADESSENLKLEHDVRVINSAIRIYQASGGDISSAASPEGVIALLRRELSVADRKRIVGFGGTVVDPRLQPILQTPEEANSSALRALWNPLDGQFELSRGGANGVKEFALNDQLDVIEDDLPSRNVSVKFGNSSGWIWDHDPNDASAVADGPSNEVTGLDGYNRRAVHSRWFESFERSAFFPSRRPPCR